MIDDLLGLFAARLQAEVAEPVLPPAVFSTLADAQAFVQARMEDGVHCPCCSQFVKVYSRSMYADMAVWLIQLVRAYEKTGDFVHVTTTDARGGDYGKLRFWSAVEQDINVDTNKKSSGRWRPTKIGIDFAYGRRTLSKKVLIFDNKAIGFTGPEISIREALGERFDYFTLMSNGETP